MRTILLSTELPTYTLCSARMHLYVDKTFTHTCMLVLVLPFSNLYNAVYFTILFNFLLGWHCPVICQFIGWHHDCCGRVHHPGMSDRGRSNTNRAVAEEWRRAHRRTIQVSLSKLYSFNTYSFHGFMPMKKHRSCRKCSYEVFAYIKKHDFLYVFAKSL